MSIRVLAKEHPLGPYYPPFKNEGELTLFLVHNLYIIEQGLKLYGQPDLEGLQFRCAGKRLDILAEDRYGGLLIIEVKFGDGEPSALGQLQGYIAWIKRTARFAGRHLRGLVLCKRAHDLLLLAAEDAGCVSVYEWTQEPRIVRVIEALDPIEIPERIQPLHIERSPTLDESSPTLDEEQK